MIARAFSHRFVGSVGARLSSPAVSHSRCFASLIGKRAPSFETTACMPNDSFKTVKLSDYAGQYLVLYFYPGDFTFVCASETIEFHKMLPEFEKRGCAVLGCSTDTGDVHKAWKNTPKESGGLGTPINHPLLDDCKKEISRSFDVLLEDKGKALRGVVIVDKQGNVRSELKNDLPLGRNVDEVLRILDSLIFVESNEGQVCPVNWKPGQDAMKPSTEGVAAWLTKHT